MFLFINIKFFVLDGITIYLDLRAINKMVRKQSFFQWIVRKI